jgi:hypothetical protein
MRSSKCTKCGLVNPLDVTECKRCGTNLTEVAPEPVKRTGEGNSGPPGGSPALVSGLCVMCGTGYDVHVRYVTRTYTPNWVWLFLPLGIIPAGIIGLIVQVKHSMSLPICTRCDRWRTNAGLVSWLAIIACIFVLISGVGCAIQNKSLIVFIVVTAVILAIAFLAGRFDRSANPRYTRFTKERVEIDAPGQGLIVVYDRANQQGAKN